MTTNGRFVLSLHELARTDARRAGVKAANLGDLLRAGFPVPAGFVLTVEAFERFTASHGFSPASAPDAVAAAPLPPDVVADLAGAHRTLLATSGSVPDAPLAVRSSGVAEDLPGASFAGQYETVLGVRGGVDVQRAVARCWASAYSARVTAYQARGVAAGVPAMAVLVQLLVQADAAGVAFSANPVTGDRDEVVVSAVRGLGERLVSGVAQPDEWFVRDRRIAASRVVEGAIGPDEAEQIAALVRDVETHFGVPQDVEWALLDGALFVLQARPVTGLPVPRVSQPPRSHGGPAELEEPLPVPIEAPEGFWQREASHFPRPLSRMGAGILDAHNRAFREMFSTYGLLLEGIEMREIGGWIYARAVPLGGKDRPTPPPPLLWLLARIAPPLRARLRICRAAIAADLHGRHVERWYGEWQPDLARRVGDLTAVDLPGLTDAGLESHLETVEALVDDCLRVHFLLHGAMVMLLGEFTFACRDLLGWSNRKMLELLAGLSGRSTEPAERLAELARIGAASPGVRPLLDRFDQLGVEEVLAADPAFGEAFRAYLREFGCRVLGYELVEPTLAERPDLVLGLVRDQVLRTYDPAADAEALAARRISALTEARATLAGRVRDLVRFERALARAERAYPVREDSELYTVSAPLGILRYAALEVGRRLESQAQLDAAEDVFFLAFPEAHAALRSGHRQHETVARRRRERAWVEAHPGPATYGRDPGPPPPAAVFPGEAAFAMAAVGEVLLDEMLAQKESQQVQATGEVVTGIAAAIGMYQGPARVVMDERDFGKVQAGDVLVCPITSPVWSVLFPSIGALVTDTGGILSHAAIIAREYRIPAVVGTGNATTLLRDGQLVTVDGDAGAIHLAAAARATAPARSVPGVRR